MTKLTVLREAPAAADPIPEGTLVDVPHPNEEARDRFRRPGAFSVGALAWREGDTPLTGAFADFDAGITFTVDSVVGWLPSSAAPDRADVVKQVSFLWATPGWCIEDFRTHYRMHVDVARRHMPALWQYVQHDVVAIDGPASGPAADVVAISTLWFATSDDFLHRYFASPGDAAEFRSHEGFLDLGRAFSFVCTTLGDG
jgi:hypothetical protein